MAERKYRLPAQTVLRAKRERTLINPCDVEYQGDLLQRLGGVIPSELVEDYRAEGIRLYEADGCWWAEPL